MKQKEFHNIKSIKEAKEIFCRNISFEPHGYEKVSISDAYMRTLSKDITAPIDVPPFDRSQMDGYGVIAEDTFPADEENPVSFILNDEIISAGTVPKKAVEPHRASKIATGAPIPKGANAVVMVEFCNESKGFVGISKPVYPGENVMHAGQDIMQGEIVLRKGRTMTFRETGVLAALGITEVDVFCKPRVAVISTGNEIIAPGSALSSARIYDTNSQMIMDACRENGAIPSFLGIAKDCEKEIENLLARALEHDIVILTGGTSAGEGDMSYRVIDRILKPGIVVHGVAIKPGKPVVLAAHEKKPVVVLPGFPASCIITFNVFIKPVIRAMAGLLEEKTAKIKAKCAIRYQSAEGRHEFVLSNIVKGREDRCYVYPITKTSGAVTSFALADGYVEVRCDTEYVDKDEEVDVTLLSDELVPDDIVFIGSQCMGADLALGMLTQFSKKVINVGSSGGLIACKRDEPDISGIHLIDSRTGTYNKPFMEPGLVLVRGYVRKQGIMFRGGYSGKSLDDFLSDGKLTLINRNNGSGTRILFDMLIDEFAGKNGLDVDEFKKNIKGYNIESKSHNSVACAIAAKKADWGIGIYSAAKMYGLEFIELRDEHYDFCIPKSRFHKKSIQEFISVLKSGGFKRRVEALGGFVVPNDIGEVVWGS